MAVAQKVFTHGTVGWFSLSQPQGCRFEPCYCLKKGKKELFSGLQSMITRCFKIGNILGCINPSFLCVISLISRIYCVPTISMSYVGIIDTIDAFKNGHYFLEKIVPLLKVI